MKILSRLGIYLSLLMVTWLPCHTNPSGDSSSFQDSVQIDRLILVGGASGVAFALGHGVLNNLWWKGAEAPFHVNTTQDYLYALNADKIGHAFFAQFASSAYSRAFLWCGLDSSTSAWAGFGIAMSYQTYIEIRDGFSKDYGFSWGDMSANVIGASLPLIKQYVPAVRPFDLQVSFYPSSKFRSGAYNAIIDDYESTTHWIAFQPFSSLPVAWQAWYPKWIGLAVGHTVANLDGTGGGNHRLFISLDWNLKELPGLPRWLHTIFDVLHFYHLPAPAVEVYPNVVWYGFKF